MNIRSAQPTVNTDDSLCASCGALISAGEGIRTKVGLAYCNVECQVEDEEPRVDADWE